MTSPVAYWHVPDIEAKLAEVTAAGATVKEPAHNTQKSAKSTTAIDTTSEGFSDEERGARKERVKELKASARCGPRTDKADGESAVLAKIAEMPEPDRVPLFFDWYGEAQLMATP